ncbi:MAG: toll/interleukin-1 receptor domain-containing protein [Bacteroidota bacterium]
MNQPFQAPLTIYVLWHHMYSEGRMIAERIFSTYNRDARDPLTRRAGIPVVFRTGGSTDGGVAPRPIAWEESQRNAIVLLVEDYMVIDPVWQAYAQALDAEAQRSGGGVRLFPVAINGNAFSFPVASTNYIRLFESDQKFASPSVPPPPTAPPSPPAASAPSVTAAPAAEGGVNTQVTLPNGTTVSIQVNINIQTSPEEQVMDLAVATEAVEINAEKFAWRLEFLIGKLTHELCRFLFDLVGGGVAGEYQRAAPVRLFISHAKADGTDIAERIRNHIHADTSLKSFFDANDIAAGHRFSDELHNAIAESAIISVQTDKYATREWCLWEVITAKRLDRPVVVLNAVAENEPRSFPYLGNVPTMRWKPEHPDMHRQISQAITLALFEVLNHKYHRLFEEEIVGLYQLSPDTTVLGHPPELFTILRLREMAEQAHKTPENRLLVVYPDPPLGDEEVRLLEELAPALRFVTPTVCSTLSLENTSHD